MKNILQYLFKEAFYTFRRFPVTLLWAVFAFTIYTIAPTILPVTWRIACLQMMLLSLLGLPLTFGIQMWVEKNKYSPTIRWTAYALGNLLLVIYFFSVCDIRASSVVIYRHLLFVLAMHVLVTFIPYFPSGSFNAFWQYNKSLFLSLMKAILLSVILYSSIQLIFLCLEGLFGVNTSPINRYIRFLFVFVFNTYFFLANLPKKLEDLEEDTSNIGNWIGSFAQRYYLLLIPLAILLNLALWWHIAVNGVTAKSYFLVILEVWLILISLYFIFKKEGNINFLSISLFVLVLFAAVSPFNVFNLSAQSQANRLEHIFDQKRVFIDGKFNQKFEKFSKKEFQSMQKIITYLSEQPRIDLLQPLFGEEWVAILEEEDHPYKVRRKLQGFLFDNISPTAKGLQW